MKKVFLRELLESGIIFLENHGIKEPRRNAEIILSHILNKPCYYIYTENLPVSPTIITAYNKILKERGKHIPLQYLLKTVNFFGYNFFIEEGVFIPRPETEILIEKAVEIYKRCLTSLSRIKILDIGTGSGNIAISLLREIKTCYAIATDISENAIKIANYNAKTNRVKSRIKFLQTDIFPPRINKFHMILSNPPYIPNFEISSLDREVGREPITALAGGDDGLNIIKKIIERADMFLYSNGFLLMEIGDKQGKDIKKMRSSLDLLTIEKDFAGIERIAVFHKK